MPQKWLRLGQRYIIARKLPVSSVERLILAVTKLTREQEVDLLMINLTKTKGIGVAPHITSNGIGDDASIVAKVFFPSVNQLETLTTLVSKIPKSTSEAKWYRAV